MDRSTIWRWSRRRAASCLVAATGLLAPNAVLLAQQPPQPVAFVNVNVIPMDRNGVVADQTVIVSGGRIAAVGPASSTPVPDGALRVDASGKYLVPGLAEMHGHVPAVNAQGTNRQFVEDVLFLYVAAGATTVRGMQGHPTQLELRARVDRGELIGPRLVLAGPQLSGQSAPDAETAQRRVQEQQQAGFDLLKIQEGVSLAAYDAIVAAARARGMPFGGHVPDDVGLQHALASGQGTIDHLDNYVAALREGGATPERIAAIARETRTRNVAVVPTMALWEVLLGAHDVDALLARPELRYMPRPTVDGWANNLRRRGGDAAAAREEVALRNRILAALHEADVRILMGTDAPQLFSVPGFSLYRELRAMAAAGMPPDAILRSGTVAVARHFGIEAEAGTVAAGKRADLLLLDANPLADIANVERRAGVVVNGRWLSETEIRRRLDEIASRAGG